MNVVLHLVRFAGLKFYLSAILSIIGGLFGSFVIKQVNDAIHSGVEDLQYFFLVVIGCLSMFVILSLISTRMLQRIIQELIEHLSLDLGEKILHTPFEHSEGKEEKLFTALTYDIYTISNIIERVPTLFVSISVVVSCVTYLLFISLKMSALLITILLVIFLVIKVTNKKLGFLSNRSRVLYDTYVTKTNGLIYGIKELFQNDTHSKHFLEKEYKEILEERKNNKVEEKVAIQFAGKLSESISLFGLALILGYTLYFMPEKRSEFSEIFTLALFIVGPLNNIASFSKGLKPFDASINHIESLQLELTSKTEKQKTDTPIESNHIRLNELEFKYESKGRSFGIGPISVDFKPGSVSFITGGNGSGKTTLAKVLTGLYTPTKGFISCGNQELDDDSYQSYRNLFSVIWNDNFIFEDIRYTDWKSPIIDQLLKDTDLTRKTSIEDGVYQNTKLSSGQLKRLSLITSLLEDKEVYLFDEWSANQDIEFKQYFYEEIIPNLKKQGKTVIAVTHDKEYFHLADQTIELRNGEML